MSSRFAESQKVYSLMISGLLEENGYVYSQMHPTLSDVRAFDWWNYGGDGLPRFSIRPRYSALISRLQDQALSEIIRNFRSVRRQEIRKFLSSSEVEVSEHVELDELLVLYNDFFLSKGISPDSYELDTLSRIYSIRCLGGAKLTAVREPGPSGALLGCALVLDAAGFSNLVMKVTSPIAPPGLSTFLAVEAIKSSKSRGSVAFDFNGANSPRRGDDKHSYGADDLLYFELELALS